MQIKSFVLIPVFALIANGLAVPVPDATQASIICPGGVDANTSNCINYQHQVGAINQKIGDEQSNINKLKGRTVELGEQASKAYENWQGSQQEAQDLGAQWQASDKDSEEGRKLAKRYADADTKRQDDKKAFDKANEALNAAQIVTRRSIESSESKISNLDLQRSDLGRRFTI